MRTRPPLSQNVGVNRQVILAVAVLVAACGPSSTVPRDSPAVSPVQRSGELSTGEARPNSSQASPQTTSPREVPTAADEKLARSLVEFARAPSASTLTAVPFAAKVRLGLSDRLRTERSSVDLARPDAWVLQESPFRGHIGPFSALDLLAKDVPLTLSVGPHPHCASPAVPAPADFAASRRLSLQPKNIDTCLLWWTVDLFVSAADRIEAVTLDLWEP